MYIEDEIVIDDSYIKGGGTADILRGTWLVHGKPNIQVSTFSRTLTSADLHVIGRCENISHITQQRPREALS